MTAPTRKGDVAFAPGVEGHDRNAGMSGSLTLLFAVASGVAVGNLYWAQPLLESIARSFSVTMGAAGLLVTLTQIGYAVGILLIVPLGDMLDRRRLIPAIMGCSVLALTASAAAPSFSALLLTLAGVGATTVTGQLLAPLASDLASDEQRGRVVGSITSGLLTGILVSRTVSGLLADALGWRAVYAIAAVTTGALAVLLARALPVLPARSRVRYSALLGSVFTVVRQHRSAQVTLVIGALAFSVFSMFWTGLTFLLSAPPYSYSTTRVGLVGLVGLAGALAARRAGRLHDRGWSVPATGAGLVLVLLALVLSAVGSASILLVLLAVLLFDIGIQGVNVLNQTRLLSIDPAARSRLNTAFVAGNFAAGAIGSSVAGLLWHLQGWVGVSLGAVTVCGGALLVWLSQRGALWTGRAAVLDEQQA